MKEPNFAAVYCCIYPELAKIARAHGYALAIHGSMARDFDLVCIPWVKEAGEPKDVIAAISAKYALRNLDAEGTPKEHGRLAFTISVAFGECALDLSFMPRVKQ